ncbi:MAG: hypothetical protein D8M57_06950 [Candidatus Scalindua sp. AMX11]|nr:MAG: hypothetical protein DWQ00_14520 [Candidatus Scalindua sp.]NOG85653.1 hypothetical protein [Planctomycetota bacterium]RZV82453.1 MAG: hypothetical protein EX341_09800 [Candidatus Scalindua sp. SCAELEC01]TDE65625.1 MAG: hypothetical protein D8M57_06950 [Candidatus Scalindua sp. AMX11]GJQ59180.1 MAG: hypothetical protein SCALA701_19810 [Candidatus Scalindua sp.]
MAVRDDIDQYIAYFNAQNQQIENVALPLLKKVFYLVEIDTLSRAAFPSNPKNRKRVVQFIDTCSNWDDKDKVSAVQLQFALEKNGILSGSLYDSINQRINSWGYGQIIRPNDDLSLGEAQRLSISSESQYVKYARYAELLYTYRNHLLHEFREPGHGMDLGADLRSTPYYLGMDRPSTGQSSWELVFPSQFLRSLCKGCINGLEAHLSANNLNPYDAYEFGSMWQRPR